MIKNSLKQSIYAALFVAGSAQAADSYIMVGGNFDFYDASGTHVLNASHSAVFADGILAEDPGSPAAVGAATSQAIDFTSKTGRMVPGAKFNGVPWIADVVDIRTYDGAIGDTNGGAVQNETFVWQTESWFINGAAVTCRKSASIDGCIDENASGGLFLGTTTDSYTYTLSEGQFAMHLFFDWSAPGNVDIPVLAVYEITGIDTDGNIITTAVDSDADGSPGHAMATDPFPGQTPAFSGAFRPVTKDATISAQSSLTTNEDVPINITKADFTAASSFPSSLFLSTSTVLSIGAGSGYTTDGAGTVTPALNVDTDISVPVGLKIFSHSGLSYNAQVSQSQTVGAGNITSAVLTGDGTAGSTYTATVTLPNHGYTTGDVVVIADASEDEYNGSYSITVVDSNTFTYTYTYNGSSSSSSPATGNILAFNVASTATNSMAFASTIAITPVNNDAPSISCSYQSLAQRGVAYSQIPVASDPDTGDTLSFSFTSDATSTLSANTLPTGLSFNTSTGEISGTPTVLNESASNIVVTVTDTLSGGLTDSCTTASITVTGLNTDPVMTTGTPTATVDEDANYSFDVTCTDADVGDSISSYTLSSAPQWMSIDSTGLITGIPRNDDVGVTTGIVATCNDSAGGSDSVTFSITVNNTNDAPTLAANDCVTESIEARSSYSCQVVGDDVDVGDVDNLIYSASGLPASLSIDTATGIISGTLSDVDVASGSFSISVTAADQSNAVSNTISYVLTVTAFNEPPVAEGALYKTPVDTDLNGTLAGLVNDPENCGCLTYRKEPVPIETAFGSVVINSADGTFVYTPNAGYNGTDSFDYIVTDELRDSNKATVQIIVGTVEGETYAGSNFTMFDGSGANANGGTNDVIASWDGLFNTDESDTDFTHMTLSSITPYFGNLWTAHHIRVYGPGTYTFDTTCTTAQIEAGMGGPGNLCNNPLGSGQTEQFLTMTVDDGQVGAHILFDWSVNLNIDVVNVWNTNSEFDISSNPGTGVLYNGSGYGPYPWSGAPSADTVWKLASSDDDGDGIPGIPMVDGKFIGFSANFNLDIVSTGSNFTMFDGSGANANGGTNDVVAKWDGLLNSDESDTDFTHMTLSSITPYFGNLWTAHHIRVYGPGTYTFDTTCTTAQIEAGMGGPGNLCNNPLGSGQTEQFLTMTVGVGQIGAHILFDWSVNLNIDVVNVWAIDAPFDVNNNPGTGVLYNGEGYGPYPWSGAPAADTQWRMASIDGDGDGIPGIPMVDGKFIGFSANFNLFVGSGSVCEPTPENSFCGTKEVNPVVSDPVLGGGSAFGLSALYIIWLGLINFGYRRRQ